MNFSRVMQTFLPYPSFERSARVLDRARLGKQRVEALQVLRAVTIPTYGWRNHPVAKMWRGYIPALTKYALEVTDVWIDSALRLSESDLRKMERLTAAQNRRWSGKVPSGSE